MFLRLLFILSLNIGFLFSDSWYVSPNGSDSNDGSQSQPFQSISRGITVSQNGDSVLVNSGTFNTNLTINKNITIISINGPENTIIYNNLFSALTFTTPAQISGFTVRSSLPSENFSPTCQISGETNSAVVSMDNMIFTSSNIRGEIIDIYNGNLTIQNSIFFNNTCSYIIRVGNQSSSTFINCNIVDNNNNNGDYNYLSFVQDFGLTTFTNCIIRDNLVQTMSGFHNINYSNISGNGNSGTNIDADPLFCNAGNNNYYLYDNSPCLGSGKMEPILVYMEWVVQIV